MLPSEMNHPEIPENTEIQSEFASTCESEPSKRHIKKAKNAHEPVRHAPKYSIDGKVSSASLLFLPA